MDELNSPLDIKLKDLEGLELEDFEEISVEGEEAGRLAMRTITLAILLLGSILLVTVVFRRGRGSWKEVIGFTFIQIVWQGLAWYSKHIDPYWVQTLHCKTVDCEINRKIYVFVENLFHGIAVYSGVALVGRLEDETEGLIGVLLWILGIMSAGAPLLFAVVILLLDLTMTYETRTNGVTEIGVAIAKTVWFDIIPSGLLLCWFLGQCLNGFTRIRSSSSRETASKLIGAFLIVFHTVHLASIIVYVVAKSQPVTTQIKLATVIGWLLEIGYSLAALAIPWCWLAGLLIPRRDSTVDSVEVNLKLAKQNKSRNIIKYKKEKSNVQTPPTTPFKFKPEVTSSPSVHSQDNSSVVMRTNGTDASKDKSKRSSYLEAVSMGSLNMQESNPPKSKSADPIWLNTSKV
ncbi:uncharacterized protein LOC111717521 [Eurytemora carolleeae]|uniref:uncharacterized protein LOC111717521 n=1 Tax=Eurytemora carolleeae TaxID=1294199 RepID=UPI000C786A0F|nr:uncharacterized protein LOC111717521 [Eurytemora carolleeae]|eukprot:XP_023348787.1 uncharacterized protein LOC111717521 [Eurytemora affinis]